MADLPFFKSSLRDFFRDVRNSAGLGSLREWAKQKPCLVSLSTMKAMDRGDHIRAEQFSQIRRMFRPTPVDWIEWKIRYAEAYMQEYILAPNARATLDAGRVATFAAERERRLSEFGTDADWSYRLSFHVSDRLKLAGVTVSRLADPSGGKARKKDQHSVKYPTVTALRRGDHVRPEKFGRICRQLGLNKIDLAALKISYVEGFLREFLLGREKAVWSQIDPARHHRSLNLLIFSTQNIETLA